VRTLADFDNFPQAQPAGDPGVRRKYALLEPMRDFLTVIDNLDLAFVRRKARPRT